MANTCVLDDMIDGAKCINKQLSEHEKMAASVFYLCAALDACEGGSCDIDDLMEDAACLRKFAPEDLNGFQVYSDKLAAIAAGASLDGSMNELQEGIKCLRLPDNVTLQALVMYLRCQLRACVS